MNGSGDILQHLLTGVLDIEGHFAADVIDDGLGDADTARLSKSFKPSRDVHAIAVDVVAVDDDVAEVDAHAEFDAGSFRHFCISLGHSVLDLYGAAQGIHDTGKLDKHAIAGRLHDPAAALSDLRVDQLGAMSLKALKSAFLVATHEPTVAGHVSG
jgi:hypothetical protein